MNNLLSANFWRLKKSRVFWGCLSVMLAFSLWMMFMSCQGALRAAASNPGLSIAVEQYLLRQVPCDGLPLALFAAVFLGVEHSDGTLRNKLIAGHTRTAIYFSNLAVCCTVSLALAAAHLLGDSLVGFSLLGAWQSGAGDFCSLLAMYAALSLALASLFTLIGMLSTRRTATMALCLLSYLLLLVLASYFYNALGEPEMVRDMIVTTNGVEAAAPQPNPAYIGGAMRVFYEWMVILLPTGQAIKIATHEAGPAALYVFLSAMAAAVTTAAGVLLFRKKDLK